MARIEINPAGIRQLLRSDEVQADLAERAERVRAAADSAGILVQWEGDDRHPMPYDVEVHVGRNRARARIVARHPAGLAAEAKYHMLTAALDAAR